MKVAVDEIPKSGKECLFGELIGMTGRYKCAFKTGLYSRCNIDCGEECRHLFSIELVKEGEKHD